jgi:hypothetical protein
MLLGFKEFYDTKKLVPSWFREKILTCAAMQKLIAEKPDRVTLPYPKGTPGQSIIIEGKLTVIPYNPKIHTFREDPHDRWKPGMSIQMVYRGKNYSIKDYFNKGIPELSKCISTQKIEINWNRGQDQDEWDELATMMGIEWSRVTIYIDGIEYCGANICGGYIAHGPKINELANNDGFNGVDPFLKYFKNDFIGKVIHWTDKRY